MVIRQIWVVSDLQWVGLGQDQEGPTPEWVRWVAQVLWVEWEVPDL